MKKKFKLSKRTKNLGTITLSFAGITMINIIRDQQKMLELDSKHEMYQIDTIATLGEKLQPFMGKEAFMDFVKSTCCKDGYSVEIIVH